MCLHTSAQEKNSVLLFLFKEKRFFSVKSKLTVVHNLFGASDKEDSPLRKGTIELLVNFILCLLGKVDHDIPADDQMTSAWINVLEQIVLLKFHAFFNLFGNLPGVPDFRKLLFL